jgi:hypothetical protein
MNLLTKQYPSLMKTRVFTSSLLFLMFIIMVHQAKAQWTTASNNIYNSNTGNVGINNTNPLVKLAVDISSTTTTYNGYTGANVALMLKNQSNTANNFTVLSFANSGTNTIADITAINTSHTNHTGRLSFSTRAAGAGPQQRMLIDENGNVGIGTNTPNVKLEVAGVARFTGSNAFSIGGDVNQLRIQTSSQIPNQSFGFLNAGNSFEGIRVKQVSVGGNYADLHQAPLNGLIVEGNVGIGTTIPDAKLAVKGTIHTQEVRVDLNGAVAPDYVFEKDYSLMPLDELKTYIDTNKHLPEVPSAKEMEENGVNLKEMNLLLLKKVEELTLYLIEQNKLIDKLQAASARAEAVVRRVEELTIHIVHQEKKIQGLEEKLGSKQ